MTSMRAQRLRQAGWISLGVLVISGGAKADPALPPPVGQNVYQPSQPGGGNSSAVSDPDSSFDNLEIIDSSLHGKVAVLRVGSEVADDKQLSNKLLSIFADLKNKTGHRLDLEMETIYKDKDDNALNAGSWISFTLRPHEEKEYRSTSISEEAVDFLVRVRRAPAAASTQG